MKNTIFFVILFAMLAIVCYMIPQAIDESSASTDKIILQHKLMLEGY